MLSSGCKKVLLVIHKQITLISQFLSQTIQINSQIISYVLNQSDKSSSDSLNFKSSLLLSMSTQNEANFMYLHIFTDWMFMW